MSPAAYLVVFLGAALLRAAYQTQAGWLYVTGAGALALLGAAWLLALGPLLKSELRARPMAPCRQGDTMRMIVESSGGPAGRQVLWATAPASSIRGWWRASFIPGGWQGRLVPSGPAAVELTWPALRRGEFKAPAVLIQSAFPLGLVLVTRRASISQSYLVFPRGAEAAHLPWLAGAGSGASGENFAPAAQGIQFRGVREQRPGDAWKLIHWPTTARRGQFHIKETEETTLPPVVLYLDARRSIHTERSADHVVEIAASIAAWCEKNGRSLSLLTQSEATPDTLAAPYLEASWLARFQAIAHSLPLPPKGAILISPASSPGWRSFASAFIHCPAREAEGDSSATLVCPLDAPIGESLGGPA